MKKFLCLLLLVLAPAAYGQELVGDEKVPVNKLARIQAKNVDDKAALVWRVYPGNNVDRATNPRGVFEFTAPAGKYLVELLVISGDPNTGLQVKELFKTVEIGGPGSQPEQPQPQPKPKDPVQALGRITFGSAGCTATVIGPRRPDGRWDILTAAHCMPGVGSRGTMELKDGRRIAVRVVVHEKGPDLAWLVTDADNLDLPHVFLAEKNPESGTKIWHAGYGVDRPTNREDGVVSGVSGQQLKMVLNVSSGDSGGGIFDANDNVISTVCCTTRKGARVDMYGATTELIRRARPKANVENDWNPLDIPIVDAWVPQEIPECCGRE